MSREGNNETDGIGLGMISWSSVDDSSTDIEHRMDGVHELTQLPIRRRQYDAWNKNEKLRVQQGRSNERIVLHNFSFPPSIIFKSMASSSGRTGTLLMSFPPAWSMVRGTLTP